MLTQHWVEDTTGIHAEWVEEQAPSGAVDLDATAEGDHA